MAHSTRLSAQTPANSPATAAPTATGFCSHSANHESSYVTTMSAPWRSVQLARAKTTVGRPVESRNDLV